MVTVKVNDRLLNAIKNNKSSMDYIFGNIPMDMHKEKPTKDPVAVASSGNCTCFMQKLCRLKKQERVRRI